MSDDDFDNDQQPQQPKDPAQAFIEEVTYGDPAAAAQKLREFVEGERNSSRERDAMAHANWDEDPLPRTPPRPIGTGSRYMARVSQAPCLILTAPDAVAPRIAMTVRTAVA
jgi:hypothetical protein